MTWHIARRRQVVLRLLVVFAAGWGVSPKETRANTSHHSGSGSGSVADPDADCLRWEVVGASDGAVADHLDTDGGSEADGGYGADAGATTEPDGGTNATTQGQLRCVEHAALFGCSCAVGASRPRPGSGALTSTLVAGLLLAVRRRDAGRGRRT